MADVQDAIQTAVGGFPVAQVLQGEAVYNVTARYQKPYRDTKEAIQDIRLLSPSGERVSLAQVTRVQVKDGAYDIYREKAHAIAIRFEVRDRDLGTTVKDAIVRSAESEAAARLRPGVGGRVRKRAAGRSRLLVIVPMTILVIFIILYTMFRSFKWALLILATVVMARVGGLLALLLTAHFLQRRFGVGFWRSSGYRYKRASSCWNTSTSCAPRIYRADAAVEGAVLRLRPI